MRRRNESSSAICPASLDPSSLKGSAMNGSDILLGMALAYALSACVFAFIMWRHQ